MNDDPITVNKCLAAITSAQRALMTIFSERWSDDPGRGGLRRCARGNMTSSGDFT